MIQEAIMDQQEILATLREYERTNADKYRILELGVFKSVPGTKPMSGPSCFSFFERLKSLDPFAGIGPIIQNFQVTDIIVTSKKESLHMLQFGKCPKMKLILWR